MKTAIKLLNKILHSVPARKLSIITLLVVALATLDGLQPATGASGSVGPDFLGIRIGMTPEEAQSILKARVPREKWEIVDMRLAFTNAKYQTAEVPKGIYRGSLENIPRDGFSDRYIVYLTPNPGKERVAAVIRVQSFGEDRPLFDELVAGLIDKYGQPGYRNKITPGGFIWAFDVNGKPRSLGMYDKSGGAAPCTSFESLPIFSSQITPAAGWSLRYNPIFNLPISGKQIQDSWVKTCGATMVRAFVQPVGRGFVQMLTVELIGHAEATAGKEAAVMLIEAAIAEDMARERGAAKQRSKPDL